MASRKKEEARARSEWIPRRTFGEFEVADIGAETQPDARANRHEHDIVGSQRRHAEAADEIGGSVDAAEALEYRLGPRQIVDQHHGAGAVGAGIETDRRPLPEYPQIPGVFCVKRDVAVA